MVIKTISFSGELFRADTIPFQKGINALTAYSRNNKGSDFIKYFATNATETNAYANKARYISNWEVKKGMTLTLIDILDLATREELARILPSISNSLKVAFPIREGKVARNSNANTTKDDYAILTNICALTGYDGYYMDKVGAFHSEIGLCSKALNKLEYITYTKPGVAPAINNKSMVNRPKFNSAPISFSLFGGSKRRKTLKSRIKKRGKTFKRK